MDAYPLSQRARQYLFIFLLQDSVILVRIICQHLLALSIKSLFILLLSLLIHVTILKVMKK